MTMLARFGTLLPFGFLCVVASHAVCGDDRPNIVLIMADDLGWSDIGCYGGEIGTPHIDSLADAGVRFTQFYNNSVCGPTRASLLTGLYCQQTGHRGDHWNQPKDHSRCAIVAELLQRAGYRTAMVGKWQGRDSALDRGFDRFFGPMCQGKISYFHEVEKNPYYLDRKRWQVPADFYMTDSFNRYADQFLEEAVVGEEPFFLYVAHIAPHWPLHAAERDIQPFRQRYRELGWESARQQRFARQQQLGVTGSDWELPPPMSHDWDSDPNKDWQAERMAVYAAQVASIDRGVGSLLKILDQADAADNTLVIFLSDNGAAPDGGLGPTQSGFGFKPNGKNDTWRNDGIAIKPGSGPQRIPGPHDTFAAYGLAWAMTSNTPLRGTKIDAYEGGIRTPLVIRWPTVIQPRSITHHVGHVIDWMPTLLEIAEADYPIDFDGRKLLPPEGHSLVPLFRGDSPKQHESLCWSTPRHHAIRAGDWKAIRSKQRGNTPMGKWQLYDLQSDGSETTNVADEQADVVARLSDQFEAWKRRVGAK